MDNFTPIAIRKLESLQRREGYEYIMTVADKVIYCLDCFEEGEYWSIDRWGKCEVYHEETYRVYYSGIDNLIFFSKVFGKDNDWWCTHGDWIGTDIGGNRLEHAHGITQYTHYKDLTPSEYKDMFNE